VRGRDWSKEHRFHPERDGEFERRHFWTQTYVQFMLKNEIYVGSMVQGRQYTPYYRSKKREPIARPCAYNHQCSAFHPCKG